MSRVGATVSNRYISYASIPMKEALVGISKKNIPTNRMVNPPHIDGPYLLRYEVVGRIICLRQVSVLLADFKQKKTSRSFSAFTGWWSDGRLGLGGLKIGPFDLAIGSWR